MLEGMSSAEVTEWGAYFDLLKFEDETGIDLGQYEPGPQGFGGEGQ